MDDLISRQAAIEAMRRAKDKSELHRMLVQLPSAQPVVISKSENTTECEDAVSRFEVLRLIDYSSNDLNDSVDNRYFQGKVKELPSVTPKQPGWIPTSERLPDNDRAVLVTLKWAEDDYEVAVGEYWHNSTASHGWGSFEGHVIAWHELPTPYREGGQS